MSPLLPVLTQRALERLHHAGSSVAESVLRPQGTENLRCLQQVLSGH